MTAPCSGTRSSPAISMRRKKTRNASRSKPTMMRLTISVGALLHAPESQEEHGSCPARKAKYSRSVDKGLECLCQFVAKRERGKVDSGRWSVVSKNFSFTDN